MSKCPELSDKLGENESPGLSESVLKCDRDRAGRWGQVLGSRPHGAHLGATGSPTGQEHWAVLEGEPSKVRSKTGGLTQGHAWRAGDK